MIEPTKRVIRFCLITVTVILFSSASYAQIRVGAKGGLNVNQSAFNKLKSYRFGGSLGAVAQYTALDFLDVQLEVVYSQFGGGYESYYERSLYRVKPSLVQHTLEVPVMAKLVLPGTRESSISPHLLAGASFGFGLQTTEHYSTKYTVYNETVEVKNRRANVTDDYDKMNTAWVAGAGVSLELLGFPTFIDIRYRNPFNKTALPDGSLKKLTTVSLNVGLTILDF
jgi:opacity protein-like surface antigen